VHHTTSSLSSSVGPGPLKVKPCRALNFYLMEKASLAAKLLLFLLAVACGIHLLSPEPSATESTDKSGARLTFYQNVDADGTVFVLHSVFQDHHTANRWPSPCGEQAFIPWP
jgi:hypothetical protein